MGRIAAEQEIFSRLLALEDSTSRRGLLRETVDCLVEASGATHGYIEAEFDDGSRLELQRACSPALVDAVRDLLSRGVIAEAIRAGETIHTPSAQADPRFAKRASVAEGRIEAVLCCPLPLQEGHGVIYIQRGPGAGPFEREDVHIVETTARHLSPWLHALGATEGDRPVLDPTALIRSQLRQCELAGRSPELARLLREVALIAPRKVAVLITGPSGSGKTALARTIHANSDRGDGPFIAISCALLPDELAESELFGARPGAHSTAREAILGKVEAAKGGTLLLDEVDELSPRVQAKLLQFLESGQYAPLGSAKFRSADVRVIAATNVDLPGLVDERRFREDLYWRLNVVPVAVPGLDDRQDDIIPLAEHFTTAFCAREERSPLPLSAGAVAALQNHRWPGSVRQLANTVRAGLIRAIGGGARSLTRRHLFPDPRSVSGPEGWKEANEQFRRRYLQRALEDHDWDVTATAQSLGMGRSTLFEQIRQLGLKRGP